MIGQIGLTPSRPSQASAARYHRHMPEPKGAANKAEPLNVVLASYSWTPGNRCEAPKKATAAYLVTFAVQGRWRSQATAWHPASVSGMARQTCDQPRDKLTSRCTASCDGSFHHTEKFPRHHRYSLGIAMENRLQRILELLLRAKYSKEKAAFLNDANMELEVLRFQVRLAKDIEVLPMKSQAATGQLATCRGSGSRNHSTPWWWRDQDGIAVTSIAEGNRKGRSQERLGCRFWAAPRVGCRDNRKGGLGGI